MVSSSLEEGWVGIVASDVLRPLAIANRVVVLLQHVAVRDGRPSLLLTKLVHWLTVLLTGHQGAWLLQGRHQLVAEVLRSGRVVIEGEELLCIITSAYNKILWCLNVVGVEVTSKAKTEAIGCYILW